MKTPQENISASITQLNLDPSCKLADKKSLEGNIDNFFQGKETPIQDKKKAIENKSQVKIGEERKRQGSRPKTAYKKPNQDYVGRDDKIDADLYYRVRDENDHLKKHQYQLNDEIKRITTALEKVKHGVLLERKLSDRKVIQVEGGFDVETETLKMENEKLQDKIKKMSTIIKGMQSQSVQNAGKSLGRKSLINAKTSLENQSEKNEYLIALIVPTDSAFGKKPRTDLRDIELIVYEHKYQNHGFESDEEAHLSHPPANFELRNTLKSLKDLNVFCGIILKRYQHLITPN